MTEVCRAPCYDHLKEALGGRKSCANGVDLCAPAAILARIPWLIIRVRSAAGGKDQQERTETIQRFKDGRADVLCATDIAAKGLDFDGAPPRSPTQLLTTPNLLLSADHQPHVSRFDAPRLAGDLRCSPLCERCSCVYTCMAACPTLPTALDRLRQSGRAMVLPQPS